MKVALTLPHWCRFSLIFLAALSPGLATYLILSRIGQTLTIFGWLNLGLASVIVAWYALDTLYLRRSIYAFWSEIEGPLSHLWRFWRLIILLTCGIAAVGDSLLTIILENGDGVIRPIDIAPLAVLTGAYLASFGWIYTRHEAAKSDRAKATLSAIQGQMYNEVIISAYNHMLKMSNYYRERNRGQFQSATDPLPLEALTTKLSDADPDWQNRNLPDITLRSAAISYFNALNQLSLGVRQGQLDLTTITRVLRPRFIRMAGRVSHFIIQATQAKFDLEFGRPRSRNRTLEHYLWLLYHLDVLASRTVEDEGEEIEIKGDQVTYEQLVLPPNHIIGTLEGERLPPPKRMRSWWEKEHRQKEREAPIAAEGGTDAPAQEETEPAQTKA